MVSAAIFVINMSAIEITETASVKIFGGYQKCFTHKSDETNCKMSFAVYIPPQAETENVPVLYWLSGLTCTEQNFIMKAGAQKYAADYGVMLVAPDTSPRGCNIEGEDECYDFGSGAGFYIDATVDKWKTNYRMYSYITSELTDVINTNFQTIPNKQSIFGHSMGGHGALVCFLKNPGNYSSVSAFAPICNPTQSPWGIKAFTGYLGPDQNQWNLYDACQLLKSYNGPTPQILVDQGLADNFYPVQLLPDNLVKACADEKMEIQLRKHEGYDHSYYFISTFMEDHIAHHAKFLKS